MSDWFTMSAENHDSCRSEIAVMSSDGTNSCQTGCLDDKRTPGWCVISACSGSLPFMLIIASSWSWLSFAGYE